MGKLGDFSDGLEAEYPFWRLVMAKSLPPSELDTWDLEDLDKANAMLDMEEDHKSAFHELTDYRNRPKEKA